MHVEFRVSHLSNVCAFDAKSFSFVRGVLMSKADHQSAQAYPNQFVAPNHKRGEDHRDNRGLVSLSSFSRGCKSLSGLGKNIFPMDDTNSFRPRLRVQFILERIVKLESTDLLANVEKPKDEGKQKLNPFTDEFSVKRYSVSPNEVILASLPISTAECVVKIRLIQLPPLVHSSPSSRTDLLHGIDAVFCRKTPYDESLCIGVAKIPLRELIAIRGGVRMVLQPKRSVTVALEELIGNSVMTNTLLGKDIGGSACLTFQVLSYTYGDLSHPTLLLYPPVKPESRANNRLQYQDTNYYHSRNRKSYRWSDVNLNNRVDGECDSFTSARSEKNSSRNTYSSVMDQEKHTEGDLLTLNWPAVRFMLIPYIALVTILLRLHAIILWRKPLQTLTMLFLTAFAIYVDMLNVSVVLVCLAYLTLFVRTVSALYHIPLVDSTSESLVSEPSSKQIDATDLYSRHHVFLNALVRAKVFFYHGLQHDAFYEVTLIFHIIRNHSFRLILKGILFCVALCLLSTDFFFLFMIFVWFVFYPISFRFPTVYSPKKAQSQAPLSFRTWLTAYRLNQPMRITKVVKVVVIMPTSAKAFKDCTKSISSDTHLELGNLKNEANEGASHAEQLVGLPQRSEILFNVSVNTEAAERQQIINAMRLSFALVVITDNDPKSDKILLKFLTHFKNLRILKDNMNDDLLNNTADTNEVSDRRNSNRFNVSDKEVLNSNFFTQTLNLLYYIMKNASLYTYASPSCGCYIGNLIPLELLAHPLWLVHQGDDDGITATVKVMSKRDVLKVGKMDTCKGVPNDTRSMALLAAYLLQGFSLSIYSPKEASATCTLIFPLKPSSSNFQVLPRPNLCPPHLLHALEEIWLGSMCCKTQNNIPMAVNVVVKIIATYKDRHNKRMQSFHAAESDEAGERSITGAQSHTLTFRKDPLKAHGFSSTLVPGSFRSRYGCLPVPVITKENLHEGVGSKDNPPLSSLSSYPGANLDSNRVEMSSKEGVEKPA